jgi:hypothetical protein
MNRLDLIKQVAIKLKHKNKQENNIVKNIVVKRKRGRPRKNVVQEIEQNIDSFDYDKLNDDLGILMPTKDDIVDELNQLKTFI